VPPAHSLSFAQPGRQPLAPPHVLGEQFCVTGVEQIPAPLHVAAGWKVVAFWQKAPPQVVPAAPWVQAPPVQVPVLPQGGFAGQRPCGSPAPLATLAHEPDAHVWQVPHADALQQKPSTQEPVVHSWPSEQVFPAPAPFFGWQVPFGPASQ
jgi:hypothetical protein